jgi:hypothetical protein
MDVREQGARLRKALEAAVSPRGRRHFPEALIRETTAYFVARVAEGVGAELVGPELGLAANTLRRWQKLYADAAPSVASRASAPPPPALVPLTVVAPPPRGSAPALVVRGPGGLCIEGLDLDALVALLRRLA